MIFFFDIPEILDSTNIASLAKPEVKGDATVMNYLKEVDDLRVQYKKAMTKDQILEIMKLNDGILNYKSIFDQYLKTNVEILSIVGFRPFNPPNFRYKTFISKNINFYVTSAVSNQEACAAEIMMARYSYAFSFQLDAFPHLQHMLNNIHYTFNDQFKDTERLLKEMDKVIQTFQTGIQPIQRLYNVINDVLYFLVQRQDSLIPDFKQTVFYSVKLILEVNLNQMMQEKFRIAKDYQKLLQICKASHSKLTAAQSRLLEIKNEVRDDILHFLDASVIFHFAYGLWALLNLHKRDIEYDNFKAKSFSQLQQESFEISQFIKNTLFSEYSQKKIDSDFYDFGLSIFQKVILPLCERQIAVLNITNHGEKRMVNPTLIFSQVEPKDNYFELLQ